MLPQPRVQHMKFQLWVPEEIYCDEALEKYPEKRKSCGRSRTPLVLLREGAGLGMKFGLAQRAGRASVRSVCTPSRSPPTQLSPCLSSRLRRSPARTSSSLLGWRTWRRCAPRSSIRRLRRRSSTASRRTRRPDQACLRAIDIMRTGSMCLSGGQTIKSPMVAARRQPLEGVDGGVPPPRWRPSTLRPPLAAARDRSRHQER
jgi:hypothetical protein